MTGREFTKSSSASLDSNHVLLYRLAIGLWPVAHQKINQTENNGELIWEYCSH